MDSFKSSVFGQSLVSLCFKCFIHRLLRFFRQLSKQLEKPSRLRDHNGLQYIFNLIKPLSHIPAKAENSAKISIL